jgi:hypothetical protein
LFDQAVGVKVMAAAIGARRSKRSTMEACLLTLPDITTPNAVFGQRSLLERNISQIETATGVTSVPVVPHSKELPGSPQGVDMPVR